MTNFNLKQIAEIMRPMREQGISGTKIADILNQHSFTTITGQPWTESGVSNVCVKHLKMPRIKHRAQYRDQKQKPPRRKSDTRQKYCLLEELISSNLTEELKLLVAKTLLDDRLTDSN